MVAGHDSYFVTTYKRCKQHGVEKRRREKEKRKKKKIEKSYLNWLRRKEKGSLRKSYHSKINLDWLEENCQIKVKAKGLALKNMTK